MKSLRSFKVLGRIVADQHTELVHTPFELRDTYWGVPDGGGRIRAAQVSAPGAH